MIYTKLGYTLFSPDLYSHDTRVLYTCTRVCAPPSVYARKYRFISPGRGIMRRAKVVLFITRVIIIVIIIIVILYVILSIVRTCAHTSTSGGHTLSAARPKEFGVRRDVRSTCRRGGLEGVWILGARSAGSLGVVSIA